MRKTSVKIIRTDSEVLVKSFFNVIVNTKITRTELLKQYNISNYNLERVTNNNGFLDVRGNFYQEIDDWIVYDGDAFDKNFYGVFIRKNGELSKSRLEDKKVLGLLKKTFEEKVLMKQKLDSLKSLEDRLVKDVDLDVIKPLLKKIDVFKEQNFVETVNDYSITGKTLLRDSETFTLFKEEYAKPFAEKNSKINITLRDKTSGEEKGLILLHAPEFNELAYEKQEFFKKTLNQKIFDVLKFLIKSYHRCGLAMTEKTNNLEMSIFENQYVKIIEKNPTYEFINHKNKDLIIARYSPIIFSSSDASRLH